MRYSAAMPALDISKPDLTLVREFKKRAEKALPGRIMRVMLYGSRARGDARPDSDWDIAVFIAGEPTLEDRSALSDIGFDLMLLEKGFELTEAKTAQPFADIHSRAPHGLL